MISDLFLQAKSVLLVEDELFVAEKISTQLETLGVGRVLMALDLAKAHSFVRNEHVDIAVLDVNLRDGQTSVSFGLELSSNNVPVVFISGVSTLETKELAGQFEFLEKPLSVPRLKAAMHRAVLRAANLA